jgi:hypothetical protein
MSEYDDTIVAEGCKDGRTFGLTADEADSFETYAEERPGVWFRWL